MGNGQMVFAATVVTFAVTKTFGCRNDIYNGYLLKSSTNTLCFLCSPFYFLRFSTPPSQLVFRFQSGPLVCIVLASRRKSEMLNIA